MYVGEAEDCYARLKQHHKQKEFWTYGLVVVSKTQYFTKSHVKYLEWYCHQAIGSAGRYPLENAAAPTKPYISESMIADLSDNFETLSALVGTLGFPLFDDIRGRSKSAVLGCRGKEADAKGEYTDDGFVVFQGSSANVKETPSSGPWVNRIRLGLVESGILQLDGGVYRFTRDHLFSSPSAAAAAVLARRANGWMEWKYEDGRTLDDVIRKSSADA